MEELHGHTLEYWKNNAEEDYIKVPISVLKYITCLEERIEQLTIPIVSNRRELLIAYEVKKHPFLADKYKLEYATKLVDKYLKSN